MLPIDTIKGQSHDKEYKPRDMVGTVELSAFECRQIVLVEKLTICSTLIQCCGAVSFWYGSGFLNSLIFDCSKIKKFISFIYISVTVEEIKNRNKNNFKNTYTIKMKLFLVSVVGVLLTFLLKFCTRIWIRNDRYWYRTSWGHRR